MRRLPIRSGANGAHDVSDGYLWVVDIERLREEFKSRGANIVWQTPQTFYQTRAMEVEHSRGYRLCVAQYMPQGA